MKRRFLVVGPYREYVMCCAAIKAWAGETLEYLRLGTPMPGPLVTQPIGSPGRLC